MESQTNDFIATSSDVTAVATAHVYHALAIACLGQLAAAKDEFDAAATQNTSLTPTAQKIVDEIQAKGVPSGVAGIKAVVLTSSGQ